MPSPIGIRLTVSRGGKCLNYGFMFPPDAAPLDHPDNRERLASFVENAIRHYLHRMPIDVECADAKARFVRRVMGTEENNDGPANHQR